MERQFYPFAPFSPFYPTPFYPFFPRRPVLPFFFFSPFYRRRFFYRDGEQAEMFHAQHQCAHGDTLWSIAQMYNVPPEIISEMNPHIDNPSSMAPGTVVGIPCLYNVPVQKMYMEMELGQ